MNIQAPSTAGQATRQRGIPFDQVALVLQGGGALDACQAGVYEALTEAGIEPDLDRGVSSARSTRPSSAAIHPTTRVERLREFWTQVTTDRAWPWFGDAIFGLAKGDAVRDALNQASATRALANGATGFFAARPVTPWMQPTVPSTPPVFTTPASSNSRWSA